MWRYSDLMVYVLESRFGGLGFEPLPEAMCCFLGQDTYSHSASHQFLVSE